MKQEKLNKPGVEEWQRWANVVLDRLTDVVHVYKKPSDTNSFMAEAERQAKTQVAINLLHRVHALVDQAETFDEDLSAAPQMDDEQLVANLKSMFAEMLQMLPQLSGDMQKLLKSPWFSQFPNKTAETLFHGDGVEEEGIGSGYAEQGRLPGILASLLEREQMGDSRTPRERMTRPTEPTRKPPRIRQR